MYRQRHDASMVWSSVAVFAVLMAVGPGLTASSVDPTGTISEQHLQPSQYLHPKPEGVSMGCQELTSKRYISDGFCTSLHPITERACGGLCLPVDVLPWYAEYVKVWARTKAAEWRCVDDRTKRRTVTLMCANGEIRRYEIRVVVGCRCKRVERVHNQSRLVAGGTAVTSSVASSHPRLLDSRGPLARHTQNRENLAERDRSDPASDDATAETRAESNAAVGRDDANLRNGGPQRRTGRRGHHRSRTTSPAPEYEPLNYESFSLTSTASPSALES